MKHEASVELAGGKTLRFETGYLAKQAHGSCIVRMGDNVVLGTAYGVAVGVVVDTHVHRIAARLDLTRNTTPEKIEQDLMKIIPREKWILFSHQIILHGRALCVARKPKCAECGLISLCYAKDKTA